MDATATTPKLGVIASLLQLYLRSGVRGRTRCTFALAHRLKSLQSVPIAVHGVYVFVNLEDGLSHRLLAGSPWAESPWETDEQALMRRVLRSGDVAFDIGAHIGLHTVLLSQLVGPSGAVHAFEPNPRRFAALGSTIERLPRAELHAVALGDCIAEAPLFVPRDESMASLADWTDGRAGAVEVRACAVRRLDDFVRSGKAPQPDFVKCDVEGAELSVFTGARWVLDRPDAPLILYEAHRQSAAAFAVAADAATDFLRGLHRPRYAVFHLSGSGLLPVTSALDTSFDHFNLLAVPASRLTRLS